MKPSSAFHHAGRLVEWHKNYNRFILLTLFLFTLVHETEIPLNNLISLTNFSLGLQVLCRNLVLQAPRSLAPARSVGALYCSLLLACPLELLVLLKDSHDS